MLKRVKILVLGFLLLLSLASCGTFNSGTLDPAYKNKVDFVSLKNETHHIEYLGDTFFPFYEDIIFVEKLEDDVFLGWNGSWWGYQNKYYSSLMESPVYIYETRTNCLYFREDYDYLVDNFVIENSSAEIIWRDIFYSKQTSFDFVNPVNVRLYSKQCPRIKAELQIVCVDDQWYLSSPNTQIVWVASDEFVKILSENGFI